MQIAPQLIFHDVARSDWVEQYVIERLAKLDRFAGGVTSCRATVAREQSSQHQGNLYSVMVEIRLPPQHDIAAKKQKKLKDIPAQLPALINQAFSAIERQLKKTSERRRYEEKTHQNEPHGMVEKLFVEGYGFIRAVDDDRQYYFHRNSVLHDDFHSLTVGTEVRFTPEVGEKGPQASSVQIVSKVGSHGGG